MHGSVAVEYKMAASLAESQLPQGGGFKVFDARGRKIFLREYLIKHFRNAVRYVGSA